MLTSPHLAIWIVFLGGWQLYSFFTKQKQHSYVQESHCFPLDQKRMNAKEVVCLSRWPKVMAGRTFMFLAWSILAFHVYLPWRPVLWQICSSIDFWISKSLKTAQIFLHFRCLWDIFITTQGDILSFFPWPLRVFSEKILEFFNVTLKSWF